MSIQNVLAEGATSLRNTIEGGISAVNSKLSNALDAAVASLGALWDGGFVGIADDVSPLSTAINTFIGDLDNILANFNTSANIDGALKGQAADATVEYVDAIKTLLSAYNSTYKQFVTTLEDASAAMKAGDIGNAQGIRTEKDNVLQEANSIRID